MYDDVTIIRTRKLIRWTDPKNGRRVERAARKILGLKKSAPLSDRDLERAKSKVIAEIATGGGSVARGQMTLQQLLDKYDSRLRKREGQRVGYHKDVKPLGASTIIEHKTTIRYLIQFFGADRRVDRIDSLNAMHWVDALEAGKLAQVQENSSRPHDDLLSPNTIRKHIRNAKAIANYLIVTGFLAQNPFFKLLGTYQQPNRKHYYVSMEEFEALVEATEPSGRRAFYALCRLAGLRKTEACLLPWNGKVADGEGGTYRTGVDFEEKRLRVYAGKTGKYREVPIVPELMPFLLASLEDGNRTVTGMSVNNHPKLIAKDAKAAGLTLWRAPFQSMRVSRENDWKIEGISEPTYCEWLGHICKVSRGAYVSATAQEFELVTEGA